MWANYFSLHTFFDTCEKLTGAVSDHSEEFTASESIVTDGHTAVPDADNHHDIAYVHFLQNSEKLIT